MFSYLQVKYFCAAFRHANLHRAADELFLSRQALGKSLSSLERELGGQLFTRHNDGLQPTALAERFYPEALALCERSERLYDDMRRAALDAKSPLRIGSTFSAIETVFPLLPLAFSERHPSIDLQVLERPDGDLADLVLSGEVAGAFVIGPFPVERGLRVTTVHREGLGMLMRRDHPLATLKRLSITDLVGVPLLLVNENFRARRQLIGKFAEVGMEASVAYSSGDFSLLVAMCRAGKGLVPLPRSRFDAFASEEMVAVPFDGTSDPGWQIDFICPSGPNMPYALDAFMGYLSEIAD